MPVTPDPAELEDWFPDVDISHIEIEDGEPVDNVYSEKQMRLLTEPLYASWAGPPTTPDQHAPRKFLALANVGVFPLLHGRPLVPDVMLALDVELHPEFYKHKQHNTWFNWEMGKPPDVVIEVVSNRKGGEVSRRRNAYEAMRSPYYVVWDAQRQLGGPELRAWRLEGGAYVDLVVVLFPDIGLALVPWEGSFEGTEARWLRWADAEGRLIPTGAEAARAAEERAEAEKQRAEAEKQRAEAEKQRADALEARIRELEARLGSG
jgi:hypothetical protein